MECNDIEIGDIQALSEELERVSTQYANDPSIESAWAIATAENAEMHWELISSVNCRHLQLSTCDDEIYWHFRQLFPDLDVKLIDEEWIKSEPVKQKWRNFAKLFENTVHDYNYGMLLRCDVAGEYSSANTILAPKIQFLAIEVARNREGYNNMNS